MRILYYVLLQALILWLSSVAQLRKEARWCVVSDEEQSKCEALLVAIGQLSDSYKQLPLLKCVRGTDRFTCMSLISEGDADVMALDPGMGYTAGDYFTMMPLMAEKYTPADQDDDGLSYYAVAVVKTTNREITVKNLQGKKSCHPGVGRAAGWVYPISELIRQKLMPITECNVPVKSAAAFFDGMCAPNGLARFYNPFGNNPQTACSICKGNSQVYCTGNDPFAGYEGAFNCMKTGAGDVAFVRDSTIGQMTRNASSGIVATDFELLCPDGRRANFDSAATCNWGKVKSHVVMTAAARDPLTRSEYKNLFMQMVKDFGVNGVNKQRFELFSSDKYGKQNLMFTDVTVDLIDVGLQDDMHQWVGLDFIQRSANLNDCPILQARWCVISMQEMTKCEKMIMAFRAKTLKPELNCILGISTRDCMDKIRIGDADLMSLDAADVYVAGRGYGLVPIAAEDYSGYDARTYYAVAVARRTDSRLTIFNLKSRRSCHSGVMTAAGWVIPIDKLIDTEQIRVRDCNVYFYVGQFFSKSCVPGLLEDHYNTKGTNPVNLCEACASGGPDRCQRNSEELYFGNSGAFRCLTERGGDIAFVKHTTVRENTDGRNIAEWARNRRSDDYELLCNDGTRRNIDDWKDCNMGEVPSNGIVTAGFKTQRIREIYWTLLNFAQQFFASDSNPDFKMFASSLNYKDLIFQDATVRLVSVDKEKQHYEKYLGTTFIRAMERMNTIDCITGGAPPFIAGPLIILSLFTALLLKWL